MTFKDAEIIIETIFESMADALNQGDDVEIRGFGSFKVKNLPTRAGRNPRTGQSIPSKKFPHFKIGKQLHERINRALPSTGSMEGHEEVG